MIQLYKQRVDDFEVERVRNHHLPRFGYHLMIPHWLKVDFLLQEVVPHWYQDQDYHLVVARQHSLAAVGIWLPSLTDLAEVVKFGVVVVGVVPVLKMTKVVGWNSRPYHPLPD